MAALGRLGTRFPYPDNVVPGKMRKNVKGSIKKKRGKVSGCGECGGNTKGKTNRI